MSCDSTSTGHVLLALASHLPTSQHKPTMYVLLPTPCVVLPPPPLLLFHSSTTTSSPGRILETRKTAPGLRLLDKWGVALGGGANHRMGLYDMIMIKDNHIAAAGGIK